MWRRIVAAVSASLLCAAPAIADEAAAFPDHPINIIVPYPTGGFNDTLGRLVAAKLQEAWKQPVVVDNRPGANTIIGTTAAARAKPDGHTLLVVQFAFGANPALYRSLAYDARTAFEPVILAGRSPMMLVTHHASPFKTQADVVAEARARPGAINYGSSGNGSSQHLAMALFENMAGVQLTQVPYKGSTPLLTDLASGQTLVAFDALPHALPFIQMGRVRPLAIGSEQRSPLLPDVPTVIESGVPGYVASSWHGFAAPAGTPPAVIDKLNREINRILQLPDVRETFAKQGVTPDGGTPAAFKAFINDQFDTWARVVRDAGIQPQ